MSPTVDISPKAIAKRIRELRAQVVHKRKELDLLMEELEWWEQGRRFFGESDTSDAVLPGQAALLSGEKPTLRVAIQRVMGDRPTFVWPTKRILEELAAREWLPQGKNAEHTTRSMLAKMENRGELVRVGRGQYRLPATEDKA